MPQPTIELTDEVRQDEANGPVAWLVFLHNSTTSEFDLFTEQSLAEHAAMRQLEAASDDDEDPGEWPIYPLWAGHPTYIP